MFFSHLHGKAQQPPGPFSRFVMHPSVSGREKRQSVGRGEIPMRFTAQKKSREKETDEKSKDN